MLRLRFLFLALLIATSGCLSWQPEQEPVSVSEIQAIYDQDFRNALALDGLSTKPERFSNTLNALAEAEATQNSVLKSYYTLLEGLIYLQTEELGKAAAVAPEIKANTSLLENEGIAYRNIILARSYEHLLEGRIAVETLKKLTRNNEVQHAQRIEISNRIQENTGIIESILCEKASAGDGDDGAAFIAAYQASFLVEADRAFTLACIPRVTDENACAGFLKNREQLNVARNLLATFGGEISKASQIQKMRSQIERDLKQSISAAALPAPVNRCG